jgi:membrane-associated PAP2 superfamily phosphatase
MKNIRLGNGFAVFVLFFAIAMEEAARNHDWWATSFWVVMGIVFVIADNMKRPEGASNEEALP